MAALIGSSAIAGIFAWSPHSGDEAAKNLNQEYLLRDQLLSILQRKGTVWLISSGPDAVCAYLSGVSNSTATFTASLGSRSCGPSAPAGSFVANLTLRLIPFRVILEAWPNAQE
jgi:hypothetical protein